MSDQWRPVERKKEKERVDERREERLRCRERERGAGPTDYKSLKILMTQSRRRRMARVVICLAKNRRSGRAESSRIRVGWTVRMISVSPNKMLGARKGHKIRKNMFIFVIAILFVVTFEYRNIFSLPLLIC